MYNLRFMITHRNKLELTEQEYYHYNERILIKCYQSYPMSLSKKKWLPEPVGGVVRRKIPDLEF